MCFPLSMRKSEVVLFSFVSLMLIEVCWLCLWGVVVPNLACGSAVVGVGHLCWRWCFYSAVWTLETSCLTIWALTNPSDRHPLIDCSGITCRRSVWLRIVSGYVCNHGSPSGERDTASPRGHYGERLQRDSCLKKHMKKHHPLAGDSPWRHYRRDHNIRTAGRIHHPLLRLKLASEAWPQSLGDAVSRSPLGEPWLHT